MSKMIFVNLPVADVDKSAALYEAVGFTRDPELSKSGVKASVTWSDTIVFVLLAYGRFAGLAPKPQANPNVTTSAVYALSADSREDVDTMIATIANAGGKADPVAVQDYGVMYGRSFEDLDGHVFQAVWMDVDAMPC
ncbi:MAG TPA: VOC family protein [Sphingomonadaceae bacterium]|nr:VOC family protein [Sphingomonadaceae bacterium]